MMNFLNKKNKSKSTFIGSSVDLTANPQEKWALKQIQPNELESMLKYLENMNSKENLHSDYLQGSIDILKWALYDVSGDAIKRRTGI